MELISTFDLASNFSELEYTYSVIDDNDKKDNAGLTKSRY
jgi:hypothetical protein